MAARAVYKLKAHHAAVLGKEGDLADGDKIVLHQDILNNLMSKFRGPLPSPIIFEVKNSKKSTKTSHCGVLEFSAPRKAAFLPTWMMQNLELDDGDEVQLKLKELAKATKLVLQPHERKFLSIPDPKSTLEFALRKFTALTEGDVILIKYGVSDFHFNVITVAPQRTKPPAVVLINSSPAVEFQEPIEKASEAKAFVTFDLENPAKGTVKAGEWLYYRFQIVDVNMALKFQLSSRKGDADLYISAKTTPTQTNATWSAKQSTSASDSVTIEPDDPEFSKSWYFIGVFGYKGDPEFILTAAEVLPATELKKSEIAVPSLGRLDSEEPGDAKRCPSCNHYVPLARFAMHQIHCERNNFRCPKCNLLMQKKKKDEHFHCPQVGCKFVGNKDELSKHHDVSHKKTACPACKEEVEPDMMILHQKEVCRMRLKECKFCQLKIAAEELYPHEAYCGSKSALCEVCQKPVTAKRMTVHMASDHGYNPSLTPEQRGYKTMDQMKQEWREQQLTSFGTPSFMSMDIHRPTRSGSRSGSDLDVMMGITPTVSDTRQRIENQTQQIGRAVQQECRDRSRMPSSA
eukprot:TRINITY_DN5302_c0_g1_i1.p1 TRINITY_DN5302_c0_g1~~TRINITY_DN5302_c0_g1_i1.p1  ORF type:complete len:573 (-),score=52.98 TRINITY_DN5302_c0_g1_i1:11-1729(-)